MGGDGDLPILWYSKIGGWNAPRKYLAAKSEIFMLKKLAQQTAIYGVGTILARLVNYLIVPIHTGYFPKEEYGVVTYFYAFVVFLNVIYSYGMETAFFRFANKEGVDQKSLFSTSLLSLTLSSFFFSGLLMTFSDSIATALGYPDMGLYVVWFAVILATDAISVIPFAKLRQEHKAVQFVLIRLTNVGLNIGLTTFFLIFCRQAFEGQWGASLQEVAQRYYDPTFGLGYAFGSNMAASVLTVFLLWKPISSFRWKINASLLAQMLAYGWPLIISGLAFGVNEAADRVLLKAWVPAGLYPDLSNEAVLGVYGACYKLSIFITLAVQAFKYAAEPFFFGKLREGDPKPFYALSFDWFLVVTAGMFVGVSVSSWWIADWFIRDQGFHQGLGVVPILLLANVMLGAYYNLAIWFKVADKTYFGAVIGSIGALITLTANFFLIPILGYLGSAIATLLCYTSMAMVCYATGQKHYPVQYPISKILASLGLSVTLVVIYSLTVSDASTPAFKLITGAGCILVYFIYVGIRAKKEGLLTIRSKGLN